MLVLADLQEKGRSKDGSEVFSSAAGSVVVSSTTLDDCKRNEFGKGEPIKSFELFISTWFNILVRHPSGSIRFTGGSRCLAVRLYKQFLRHGCKLLRK